MEEVDAGAFELADRKVPVVIEIGIEGNHQMFYLDSDEVSAYP